jgi:hypothetical protein
MVPDFLSVLWSGEAFQGLGVQDVESLILVDSLFLLDGGRRRGRKKKEKEEKKITMWKEGSPGAGPTLLAVQRVTAVRCN